MSLFFYIFIGLVVLLVVTVVTLWYQASAYRSLRDATNALDESMSNTEAEFAGLVAAVSDLREQNAAPTIKRPGGDSPQQPIGKQPDESSVGGVSGRLQVITSRLGQDSKKTIETLAFLKLRVRRLQQKILSETSAIQQLSIYQVVREEAKLNPANAGYGKPRNVHVNSDSNQTAQHKPRFPDAPPYDECRYSTPKIAGYDALPRDGAITNKDLIQLYNLAVTDNQAREEFQERYKPIRLGTVNAVERRQNPTAAPAPEFKETTHGEFFAVPLQGEGSYAVMPRLGLTIGAVIYNAGALGEIFSNPQYDSDRSYSRYCVRKPAIFKRDNDHWTKIECGNLELGQPD